MSQKTQAYGIDTSVLVRLVTGDPQLDYERTVAALKGLLEKSPTAEIVVSNMVIGEAYVAIQHHYGISKPEVRSAIGTLFKSGLVQPLNGKEVLQILQQEGGCGLLDRLIVNDYEQAGCITLTNDRFRP